jgi:putative ABC transport system permease protein
LAGFSGIALLAAAFGIINTQLMSVFERTKEIGLLKALGMPNKKIRNLFSVEAILIGLFGASVGIIFAFGVEIIINTVFRQRLIDIGFGSHAILISLANVLMVAAGLGLLSFIAGVFPARKAQKLDPIQALREE